MVHYIRFLSPPQVTQIEKKTITISIVVAITTDLGDTFFPEDVLLSCAVGTQNETGIVHKQHASWTGGSRALKVALQCPGKYASQSVRVHVFASDLEKHHSILNILDVYSVPFDLTDKQRAEPLVDRQFSLANSSLVKVREETGDSIARHIWDASLGFLIFIQQRLGISSTHDAVSRLFESSKTKRLRVLELGAGCGIVGIAFAQLLDCDMLLTDLDDASEILQTNVDLASITSGSTLRAEVLDWSSDLHDSFNVRYDLVLVSDCIYNPDSSVHLVETLKRLASNSPRVLVLVGFKRRHDADEIFFDHMKATKFELLETETVALPHTPSEYDTSLPAVEFYTYRPPP